MKKTSLQCMSDGVKLRCNVNAYNYEKGVSCYGK